MAASRKILIVDATKCTGCRACMLVCSLKKEGVFSLTKSRIYVVRDEEFGNFIPIICEHCEDPPCVRVCPTGALHKDHETGIVLLDESRCIGCRECTWICPFGAIRFDPEKGHSIKCDLCGGDPECVKICLQGALQYVPASQVPAVTTRRIVEKRLKAMEEMPEVM